MKRRVTALIAGALLFLAATLVLPFSPAHSALADLRGHGDRPCVSQTRSEDEVKNVSNKALAALMKAGLSKEEAQAKLNQSMLAADQSIC